MALRLVSRVLLSLGLAGTLVAGLAGVAGAAPATGTAPAGPVTPDQVQAVVQSVPQAADADDPHLTHLAKEIAALRHDIRQDRTQIKALWPTAGQAGHDAARPYLKGARDVGRVAHAVTERIKDDRSKLKTATGSDKLALEAELHGLRLELVTLLRVKDGLLDAALHALK